MDIRLLVSVEQLRCAGDSEKPEPSASPQEAHGE